MQVPDAEIAIVGAGVIGTAIAFALARRGKRVLLLDANRAASGATGWSGGVARAFHLDREDAARAAYGLQILRDFKRATGVFVPFHETGYLYVPKPGQEEIATQVASALHDTHETALADAASLNALYPGLGLLGKGGVFEPRAGFADPRLVALAYAEACVRAGGALMEGVRVAAVKADEHGVSLSTTLGEIRVAEVVLALGYAMPAILDDMGISHDLFARVIQVTLLAAPALASAPCFTDESLDIYGKADPSGGGLYIGTPTTAVSRGEISAEPLDAAHAARTVEAARSRFDWTGGAQICGGLRHADCWSEAGRGEVYRLPGAARRVIVAGGFCGGGFKMAPWAAEAAAAILVEGAEAARS